MWSYCQLVGLKSLCEVKIFLSLVAGKFCRENCFKDDIVLSSA